MSSSRLRNFAFVLFILVLQIGCSGGSDSGSVVTPGTTSQVDLTSFYNRIGFYSDGSTYSNTQGFDVNGWSFPSGELGTTLTYQSFSFTLGSSGANDIVDCISAQCTIALPSGGYSKLLILASAIGAGASTINLTVNYSDSTSSVFTQTFSDWVNYNPSSPESGQTVVTTTTHRNLYNGTADTNTAYIYGYTLALDDAKSTSSLVVPAGSQMRILGLAVIQ